MNLLQIHDQDLLEFQLALHDQQDRQLQGSNPESPSSPSRLARTSNVLHVQVCNVLQDVPSNHALPLFSARYLQFLLLEPQTEEADFHLRAM